MVVEDKTAAAAQAARAGKKTFGRRQAARTAFEIVVSIVVPLIILNNYSEPGALGPIGALLVASCVPLLFFFYDLIVNRNVSFFGAFGACMTIIGGSLSLIAANGFFYALKEGGAYIGLAIAGLVSIIAGRPLFMVFAIYGEATDAADRARLWREWNVPKIIAAFNRFTLGWVAVLAGVVALKVVLAIFLLTEPFGTPAFNHQLVTYTLIDLPFQITSFTLAVIVTVLRVRAAKRRETQATDLRLQAEIIEQ